MHGLRLDHATLNTNRLEDTIAFYKRFLDLTPGWRPDFGFPGAWLYPAGGDYPIVHLIEAPPAPVGGMVNHIAFRGTDLAHYLDMLKSAGEIFVASPVAGTPYTQVHHFDPTGTKIEVLFEETYAE